MKKIRQFSYVIRRSCITGRAVWIYSGPSKEAEGRAYRRACQKELARVGALKDRMARRKANILQMLNACMSRLPIMGELPPEKKAAARQLISISEKGAPCDRDFYNHIMEERRKKQTNL